MVPCRQNIGESCIGGSYWKMPATNVFSCVVREDVCVRPNVELSGRQQRGALDSERKMGDRRAHV